MMIKNMTAVMSIHRLRWERQHNQPPHVTAAIRLWRVILSTIQVYFVMADTGLNEFIFKNYQSSAVRHEYDTRSSSKMRVNINGKHRGESPRKEVSHRKLELPVPKSSGITGLTLYRARMDEVWDKSAIAPFSDGMVIELNDTGTVLSVVATVTSDVKMVQFVYDDSKYSFNDTIGDPFSMAGDKVVSLVPSGRFIRILNPVFDFNSRSPPSKKFTVVAYNASGGLVDKVVMRYSVTHLSKLQQPPPLPSSIAFKEKDGIAVMEAESVMAGTDWFFEDDLLGYTGSGYFRFDGNTVTGGNPRGPMTYNVHISTPGIYEVLLRSLKNNPDTTWSNDCYLKYMPNQTNWKVFVQGPRYVWTFSTNREIGHHMWEPVRFNLSYVGIHTFTISGRSMNFYIDRVVLFDTSKYTREYASAKWIPESQRDTFAPISVPVPVPAPVPVAVPAASPVSIPVPVSVPVWTPVSLPIPSPVTLSTPSQGLYFVDVAKSKILYDNGPITNGTKVMWFFQGTLLSMVYYPPLNIRRVRFRFTYPNGVTYERLDRTKPYTLNRNFNNAPFSAVDYLSSPGQKVLTVEELSFEENLLNTYTFVFDMVYATEGLFFVDTVASNVFYNLGPIANGTTYTFRTGLALTIQANIASDNVTAVRFLYPGGNRLELVKPYTMNGDNETHGYFPVPYLSSAGVKLLSVIEYQQSSPRPISREFSINFELLFIDNAPIKSPVSSGMTRRPMAALPTPPVQVVPFGVPVIKPISSPTPPVFPPSSTIESPTSLAPPSLANGKWITTGAYNVTSETPGVCFVMVGRKAVLLGGRGMKRPYLYDPVTRTWKYGSFPPIALHHMQCVVIRNKVWIAGAWTGNYPREPTVNYTYVYDPLQDKWETKSAMDVSRRRGATASVAVGDKIYVAFGNIGGHETDNHATAQTMFDVYDTITDTWTALPDGKYPRDHAGAEFVNGQVCVSGGRDGGTISGKKNGVFQYPQIAPTECYNIDTKLWSVLPNVTVTREESEYGLSCDGKFMFMAGGENDVLGATKQFDMFDGSTWTRLPDLNTARYGGGLAVDCVCNAIYVANVIGKPAKLLVETFFMNGQDTPCLESII